MVQARAKFYDFRIHFRHHVLNLLANVVFYVLSVVMDKLIPTMLELKLQVSHFLLLVLVIVSWALENVKGTWAKESDRSDLKIKKREKKIR